MKCYEMSRGNCQKEQNEKTRLYVLEMELVSFRLNKVKHTQNTNNHGTLEIN